MATSGSTFIDTSAPVWSSAGVTASAPLPPSADAQGYAGPPVPLGAAQTADVRPEAAREPSDLVDPSQGVALFTLTRMEQDPDYMRALLTWPTESLVGLHRALEAARNAAVGVAEQRRLPAHRAVIAELRSRAEEKKQRRMVATGVGLVVLVGAGYLFYRAMR